MNNETALPHTKLRQLGNVLLVIAGLGLIAGLIIVPMALSLSPSSESAFDQEIEEMATELLLPEGVSMETTVRELVAYDREFFEENRGRYLVYSAISALFVLAMAGVCIRLAVSWKKAIPFGRPTIIGLRFLGILLILQFIVGTLLSIVPDSWHTDLFFWSDLYHSSINWLVTGGPTLTSGILFLIFSWVLEYGRSIKEEQDLTI